MHRQSAVWFRYAFKKEQEMAVDVSKAICADYVDLRVSLTAANHQGRAKDPVIALWKDGEMVATVPISNADFKRLKGDMNFVAKLASRSAPHAHA